MRIRMAKPEDLEQWVAMRTLLWPESEAEHRDELETYFSGCSIDIEQVFVIELENTSNLAGFIEMNIRNFAEGSRAARVPYVEAWFVRPEFRGGGYGSALMAQAESWAVDLGFREIASDTEWFNQKSIAMHKHLGYMETERVVCFLKKLT